MSLKSEMTCNICGRFLQDPVSCPCFCVFCQEHLHDDYSKNGSIKCNTCNKCFDILSNNFPTNKLIARTLENELHLTEEEKFLKSLAKDILKRLDALQNDFKVKQKDSEIFRHDHFLEIRRHIDIQREELKAKIDQVALKMVDQINEKEKIYSSKVISLLSDIQDTDIRKANQIMLNEFRKPNMNLDEIKRLQIEHEVKFKQLQSDIAKFNSINTDIRAVTFNANTALHDDSFGYFSFTPQNRLIIGCSDKIRKWNLEKDKCSSTFLGHTKEVWCLDLIDNTKFLSGSADCTIKMWDARQNMCLKTFTGHPNGVVCLRTLDSNTFASGSIKEIKIWNIDSGLCIKTLGGHEALVRYLIRLDDGTLVSCAEDRTIKFWDLAHDACCFMTLNHGSQVWCLAILKNGQLASGGSDGKIRIWNIQSGECVNNLLGHYSIIYQLQSLESGELISCCEDKTIKIWDIENSSCIRTLIGHESLVRAIKVNQNGSLISASYDGIVKIWNVGSNECVKTISICNGKEIHDLLWV